METNSEIFSHYNDVIIKLMKEQEELNITHLAKELCAEIDLDYSDSVRRGLSKYIQKHLTVTEDVPRRQPKVLVFDIETSPIKAWVWSAWKQNVHPNQIIQDWFMLSWSAKWLFDEKVFSDVVTPKEVGKEDDSRIAESLWYMIDEADVIIAHNGNKFDIPSMNTRFILNGFPMPSSYISIDTLNIDRRMFRFVHNKLDYVNFKLGLEQKTETGLQLWKDCMAGDQEALLAMEEYNKNDVVILEQNYLITRPYIKSHPNLSLFMEDEDLRCPVCTSNKITELKEGYVTTSGVFKEYRCDHCKSLMKGRFNQVKKDRVMSTAR